MARRLARVMAGAILGFAAGLGVALAVVVARARFHNLYIESTRDLLHWQLLPVPLGILLLGWAARAGSGTLGRMALGTLAGAALGALAGSLVGAALSPRPLERWAGGTMGAGVGIIAGIAAAVVSARRSRPRRPPPGGHAARVVLGLALACAAGCAPEEPDLPELPAAPAPGADVESIVFLVGDPGKARFHDYPLLRRLQQDVETWSARLDRDSAVVVVMLGDVVYPDGMHPPGSDGYATDSARVTSQAAAVAGPHARRAAARMYFVAGNHDWGLLEDRHGARRLRNLGAFLERMRERGPWVELVPDAGTGTPHVLDLGRHLRLVLLDTAWWLFDAEPERKAHMVEEIARALADAGDRAVVVAGHHPFRSAGPHGGFRPFWETLGVRQLLARSGALLQDLESRPYRDLIRALEDVFARRRPLAFAGGHEHSLQLIRHDSAGAPRFSIVSGSASKVSGLGALDGMLFGRAAPGYARLLVRDDGAVDLFFEAAPERFLVCTEEDPLGLEGCMRRGVDAYGTAFSTRLRLPDGQTPRPEGLRTGVAPR